MTSVHRAGIAGALVLAATTLLALNGVLVGEVGAVELLDELPGVVVDVLEIPMQLGTRGAVVIVAIVAAALADRRRLLTLATVFVAGSVAWMASEGLKDVVERPRPRSAGAVISVEASASGFAFPSTHTSVATATVASAAMALRRRPDAAIGAGAVVGLSRMAVGVHLPLDIVAGLGLGAAVAALTVEVADRVR